MAQFITSAQAGVKVLKTITLIKTNDLHFGTMTIPTAHVMVSLSTSNVRAANFPSRVTFLSQSPVASNAAYMVYGSANSTYSINLPSNDVITNGPGGATALITNFVSKTASEGVDGNSGTLSEVGIDSFVVGAKLNLNGGQPFGVYTGTFDVTVNYH
ncbi:MAG: DUF4402 domain-containing protein [Bacteroidota bacterium]